jgi:hypothetical protein
VRIRCRILLGSKVPLPISKLTGSAWGCQPIDGVGLDRTFEYLWLMRNDRFWGRFGKTNVTTFSSFMFLAGVCLRQLGNACPPLAIASQVAIALGYGGIKSVSESFSAECNPFVKGSCTGCSLSIFCLGWGLGTAYGKAYTALIASGTLFAMSRWYSSQLGFVFEFETLSQKLLRFSALSGICQVAVSWVLQTDELQADGQI